MTTPATPETLARSTDMTVDEVEECLEAIRMTRPEEWRDDLSPPSVIRRIDPAEGLEREEDRDVLADAIERLPRQDRLVVSMYYLDDMRLKEIGAVLGLSESRVSRILSQATFRLRESITRHRRSARA